MLFPSKALYFLTRKKFVTKDPGKDETERTSTPYDVISGDYGISVGHKIKNVRRHRTTDNQEQTKRLTKQGDKQNETIVSLCKGP